MDLTGFADLWEHVRLLSDGPRNAALLSLLKRHAPDARVCEIGCGSGLLSLIAARMGARKVYAVEPTALHHSARALVQANNLQSVVEVLDGRIQDVAPPAGGVDLIFSELLNADPLVEGVLDAMDAAAAWRAPGGVVAPRRLQLWLALVRDASSAREHQRAKRAIGALGERWGLSLGPLEAALDNLGAYRYLSPKIEPVGPPVCWFDAHLGHGRRPDQTIAVEASVTEATPISGVAIWFSAELDDGLVLHNRPGHPGHWGHMVFGWPTERGARAGETIRLEIAVDDEEIDVRPC
ncbi:MAG: 50S ribosomal protein L11 methyltransferase [Myxococcota bacterium]